MMNAWVVENRPGVGSVIQLLRSAEIKERRPRASQGKSSPNRRHRGTDLNVHIFHREAAKLLGWEENRGNWEIQVCETSNRSSYLNMCLRHKLQTTGGWLTGRPNSYHSFCPTEIGPDAELCIYKSPCSTKVSLQVVWLLACGSTRG